MNWEFLEIAAGLRRLPSVARYVCATALVLIPFGLAYAHPSLVSYFPFILCLPVVLACALLFDHGTGIFATGLSSLLSTLLFHQYSLLAPPGSTVRTLAFLATGTAAALVIEALRGAIERLSEANRRLARSEREKAELLQQKELLVREVNHRVKNSLSLVSSLVLLQAGASADARSRQQLSETADRIRTVARAHDQLYRLDQLETVNLADYLTDLCGSFGAAHGAGGTCRVTAEDGGDIVVSADRAISLGLIVNELVTNAHKYAYPDGRAGPVIVAVDRPDPGHLRIRVTDEGSGLPASFDLDRSRGFGMKVIQALTRQLRGTIRVVSQPRGASFELVLPLAEPEGGAGPAPATPRMAATVR